MEIRNKAGDRIDEKKLRAMRAADDAHAPIIARLMDAKVPLPNPNGRIAGTISSREGFPAGIIFAVQEAVPDPMHTGKTKQRPHFEVFVPYEELLDHGRFDLLRRSSEDFSDALLKKILARLEAAEESMASARSMLLHPTVRRKLAA